MTNLDRAAFGTALDGLGYSEEDIAGLWEWLNRGSVSPEQMQEAMRDLKLPIRYVTMLRDLLEELA